LSAKTGKAYRLPTEAEWARAATLAAGGDALEASRRDAIAWHQGNAGGTTHPVGKQSPDALGLFDLFGNVGEWVVTADGARVIRGGSYRDAAGDVGPRGRAVQDGGTGPTRSFRRAAGGSPTARSSVFVSLSRQLQERSHEQRLPHP
jgi:formylglycine-generating enzyme required for sulfatase activity